ncbi:helix-turn-helix transcriptional regulator [Pseudomaricurvus alkylphenolicus]|uniref:helix-turn-helix transcriptional regulator n=1 Tax=Pseudomaricurvus alkylphenolicus TaxID=1306991 RepID=UPI0014213A87|nr:helix-turn-helix transcriptional regulator [Pseudomaricurvus alkylphenolicus]NIB38550.1 helix-turn-helix transcriptional regulator [Pseudomaricurvus alkylphenolicus]
MIALRHRINLIERVESIVLSAGNGIPSLKAVAQHLNMGHRTLQRRLESQGTTYRHLVNRIRHRKAQEFLGNQELSIKEVSYLLHYTEPANFTIAFKAMEGCSPQQYRSQL